MKCCPECQAQTYELKYDNAVALYTGPLSVIITSLNDIGNYNYMVSENGVIDDTHFVTNFSSLAIVCDECGAELGTFVNEAALKRWLNDT